MPGPRTFSRGKSPSRHLSHRHSAQNVTSDKKADSRSDRSPQRGSGRPSNHSGKHESSWQDRPPRRGSERSGRSYGRGGDRNESSWSDRPPRRGSERSGRSYGRGGDRNESSWSDRPPRRGSERSGRSYGRGGDRNESSWSDRPPRRGSERSGRSYGRGGDRNKSSWSDRPPKRGSERSGRSYGRGGDRNESSWSDHPPRRGSERSDRSYSRDKDNKKSWADRTSRHGSPNSGRRAGRFKGSDKWRTERPSDGNVRDDTDKPSKQVGSQFTRDFHKTKKSDLHSPAYNSETQCDTDAKRANNKSGIPLPHVKVQKIIAASGMLSRRAAENMIVDGRVHVDGNLISLGDRCCPQASITVDGNVLPDTQAEEKKMLMYHKPRGEIVSTVGEDTVFINLPKLETGRWINVGRLDVDSEGLLLFTNDGEIANCLAHPSYGQEREYLVRTQQLLPVAAVEKVVTYGINITDTLVQPLKLAHRPRQNATNQWYEIVLNQGGNRVVRKLFEQLGATVNRLIRVRFGKYLLPRELSVGKWQYVPTPSVVAFQQ